MTDPNAKSNLYGTPDDIFEWLNGLWGPFTLDGAANESNKKCGAWLGPGSPLGEDATTVFDWGHHRIFINPPYSQPWISKFVMKSLEQARLFPWRRIVLLLPHDSSTRWYEECLRARDCCLIQELGTRVRFVGASNGAKFATIAVVMDAYLGVGGFQLFKRSRSVIHP